MTRTLCQHMQSLFPDIPPDPYHIGSSQYAGEQGNEYRPASRPMVSAQQAFTRRLAKYLLDEKLGQPIELRTKLACHDASPNVPHKGNQFCTVACIGNHNSGVSIQIRFRNANPSEVVQRHVASIEKPRPSQERNDRKQSNQDVAHDYFNTAHG